MSYYLYKYYASSRARSSFIRVYINIDLYHEFFWNHSWVFKYLDLKSEFCSMCLLSIFIIFLLIFLLDTYIKLIIHKSSMNIQNHIVFVNHEVNVMLGLSYILWRENDDLYIDLLLYSSNNTHFLRICKLIL